MNARINAGMSAGMNAGTNVRMNDNTDDSQCSVNSAPPTTPHTRLQQHLRLQTWMSSAFPIGAYSYSHGLEAAIQDGRVNDAHSCQAWITTIIRYGSGWNDSILAHQAYLHANCPSTLQELNELSLALQPGAERFLETTQLAASFLTAANAWPAQQPIDWQSLGPDLALPIVAGALGAQQGFSAPLLVASLLQAMASNLVWVATRLIPLGQQSTLQTIAQLEPLVASVSDKALTATLDDLGSCAVLADIASLQHETLNGRVCQS